MCVRVWVSCSDDSRRSYDYRCGEGGMEIKIGEMTGMCNQVVPLSL